MGMGIGSIATTGEKFISECSVTSVADWFYSLAFEDAHQVFFAHHQQFFAINFDGLTSVFTE